MASLLSTLGVGPQMEDWFAEVLAELKRIELGGALDSARDSLTGIVGGNHKLGILALTLVLAICLQMLPVKKW